MPIVRIEVWEARTRDSKKKLVKDVTKAVAENVGCPQKAVTVVITEVPKDNWSAGGTLSSDCFKDPK